MANTDEREYRIKTMLTVKRERERDCENDTQEYKNKDDQRNRRKDQRRTE